MAEVAFVAREGDNPGTAPAAELGREEAAEAEAGRRVDWGEEGSSERLRSEILLFRSLIRATRARSAACWASTPKNA